MQKFEHRGMYNVDEIDDDHVDVHQDEYCSDTEHAVAEGTIVDDMHISQELDGEATAIEATLANLFVKQASYIVWR